MPTKMYTRKTRLNRQLDFIVIEMQPKREDERRAMKSNNTMFLTLPSLYYPVTPHTPNPAFHSTPQLSQRRGGG